MVKEFIPYEEAVAMKRLGFNEEVMSYYFIGNPKGYPGSKEDPVFNLYQSGHDEGVEIVNYNQYPAKVSSPLFQQAFRWFRERGLYGGIYQSGDCDQYTFRICETKYPHTTVGRGDEYPYEEAQLACLKEMINRYYNTYLPIPTPSKPNY